MKDEISSKDRQKLYRVIKDIASHILFETASLRTSRAISEVQTISKLFKSDALEEALLVNPSINKIGAIISRIIISL